MESESSISSHLCNRVVILLSVGIALYCLDHYFLHKCLHFADPCSPCIQFLMASEGLLSECKHGQMIVHVFIIGDAVLQDCDPPGQDYGSVSVKDAQKIF